MKHINTDRKTRRKMRVSKNIKGTAKRPRISVYRSSKYIYAQAIDDEAKNTLASYSVKHLSASQKQSKTAKAKLVGIELGKKLINLQIETVVFDRGIYSYLGRVKSLAEGLRESGLKF